MATQIDPVVAVVPGRMGSTRMPGKTMASLGGLPALQHVVARLREVEALDGIVVATSVESEDDVIAGWAREVDVPIYRGSATDVMLRTLEAARAANAGTIVTVTGDCPLIDPLIVERVIRDYRLALPDYASNRLHGYEFPIGMDVEVFPVSLLAEIESVVDAPRDREHVTLFFYEHPDRFDLLSVEPPTRQRRPTLRLTLDTPDDYRLIEAIYDALYDEDPVFGLDRVLAYLDEHPELEKLNDHVRQTVP